MRVGLFLHDNLNARLSGSMWASAIRQPWDSPVANHGFMLISHEGSLLGVALAFYSARVIDGQPRRFCNLGALCVLPMARVHTFRLIRAALRQPNLEFTDLSPSGSVVDLNSRLGFSRLHTSTYLVPNIPRPRRRSLKLLWQHDDIEREICKSERPNFIAHRTATAAHHLLLIDGDEQCYIIFRRDRRKSLPIFASILYVSNPELYRRAEGIVSTHLLRRHRIPLTLVESRITRNVPRLGVRVVQSRTKMFKSSVLTEDQIDYLYSELMCVPW